MNKLSQTSTLPPAATVAPSNKPEQVARAFAGLREVKPSDIGNEHSECPPESAGHSLQERTVAIFVGDQLTRLRGIADLFIKDFNVSVDDHCDAFKRDEAGCSHQIYDNTFKINNEVPIHDNSPLWPSDENISEAGISEKAINHYDRLSKIPTLQNAILKVANDVLSYPHDPNWSKSDAHAMAAITYKTMAFLHHLLAQFPDDRETIEQKIPELKRYVKMLKSAYKLDEQENTIVIFDAGGGVIYPSWLAELLKG